MPSATACAWLLCSVKQHLAGCNPCQLVVDNIRKTITLYKAGRPYEIPEGMRNRLREKLHAGERDADERERHEHRVRKPPPLPRRSEDPHHRAAAWARKRFVFVRLPQTDIAHQREDELRERS